MTSTRAVVETSDVIVRERQDWMAKFLSVHEWLWFWPYVRMRHVDRSLSSQCESERMVNEGCPNHD